MTTKLCCPICFSDDYLREAYFSLSDETGNCGFCGSTSQQLIKPSALRDEFELLATLYTKNPDGIELAAILKEDWKLFEHEKMSVPNVQILLAEIFDDSDIVRTRYSCSKAIADDALNGWVELRNELLQENRFFTRSSKFKREELVAHLDRLRCKNPSSFKSRTWYRARIGSNNKIFTVADMGAPPRHLASNGRANPVGIPYLYITSDIKTAVGEVRPHRGNTVFIAEINLPDNLKIIDLRSPREMISPFEVEETQLANLKNWIDFLESFSAELTHPVIPDNAAIDYIPTQYICELIKNSGYDGVMYKSAIGEGDNLALFNPALGEPRDVKNYIVSGIDFSFSRS